MKMKNSILIALLTVCLAAKTIAFKRVCYYTDTSRHRQRLAKFRPEDVDPYLCTHIMYGWAEMEGSELVPHYEIEEGPDGLYSRMMRHKVNYPDLKILMTVGGWRFGTEKWSHMLSTCLLRTLFIESSIAFLRGRGFDGLNLDFENPGHRGSPEVDKIRFQFLLQELRYRFDHEVLAEGQERLLLTVSAAAGKEKIDTAYDVFLLANAVDFVNVVAYTFHGPWEEYTGHDSPLYARANETGWESYDNVDWAANYWVEKGCPREKLVVGMALFGRAFRLADPNDFGYGAPTIGRPGKAHYTKHTGVRSYFEICELLQNGTATSYWNDEHMVPNLVSGDLWVSYEDQRSLAYKAQWLVNNGYAGFSVYSLDMDDFNGYFCGRGRYPLLWALNAGVGITPLSDLDD